jgi:hypothetical protein
VNLTFAAKRAVKNSSEACGSGSASPGDRGRPRLIIVDEPPRQVPGISVPPPLSGRVDRIVLLSAHIVERRRAVSALAVIREGRLLALTTGGRAPPSGHLRSTVEVADLAPARGSTVTQSMLVEGRNRAQVYEPSGTPPPGFAGDGDARRRVSRADAAGRTPGT